MPDFDSLNQKLEVHFKSLMAQRCGKSVYLIEHDLDLQVLGDLFNTVGHQLRNFGLSQPVHGKNLQLPLLVAATEVAYKYQGNGTEYWPLLSTELKFSFNNNERTIVRELFKNFKNQFNGPAPPDTEWSRNFNIICWPIANAILPLDMRLPFSEAMAAANFSIAGQEHDQIQQRLRSIQVSFWSTRYRHWLATGTIAADLARYFLNDEIPPSISSAVLKRIGKDMVADRQVRLALRNARIRQSAHTPENGNQLYSKLEKRISGKLQLRLFDGHYRLEGIIPIFTGDSVGREWLQRNSRNRRWQPKPWGLESVPVLSPSELLFGTPFVIPVRQLFGLESLPSHFFSEEDSANLPELIKAWSRSVAFSLDFPAIFDLRGEGLYQRSITKTVSPSKEQLIIFLSEQCRDLPVGVAEIGCVGSYIKIVKVVGEYSAAIEWLGNFGIHIGSSTIVTRISPPSIVASENGQGVFLPEDIVGFRVEGLDQETEQLEVKIEIDDEIDDTIYLTQSGIFIINSVKVGSYKIIISDSKNLIVDIWSFRIAEVMDSDLDQEVCDIKIETVSGTTIDLLSKSISLEINSVRELTGLRIEIRLSTEDHAQFFSHQSLPLKIGVNNPVWKDMVGDNTRRCISRGGEVKITVNVVGVAEQSCLLENDSPSVWWSFDEDGKPKPISENGDYDCHRVPLTSGSLIYGNSQASDVELLVPAISGDPKFELPCVVWCPTKSSFPPEPYLPKRMPRRMENVEGYYGVREWVQKYIALVCAKSPHAIAAMNCDRFMKSYLGRINAVIGGENWELKRAEQEELLTQKSPLQVFLESAKANKAGFVELESKTDIELLLERELLGHVATVLPAYWWRFPVVVFTDSQGEQLDLAFQDAYFSIADKLGAEETELESELRSVSPFTETTCWQKTLLEACESLNWAHLASLVVPLEGGDSLVRTPVEGLGVEEMTNIILDWRSEYLPNHRSSAEWTADRLRTAFCLYLYPSHFRETDWEPVIEALITDRVTARAILFLVWKKDYLERLD
jgi:hypothetical protein